MAAEREVRVDLRSLDDETVKALWEEHRVTLESMARRLFYRAQRSFVVITYEDLVDVGKSAICEAWVRFGHGHASGKGGLHSWAERMMRWRMTEAIDELRPEGLTFAARADAHNGGLAYRPADIETAEERLQRTEVRRWLRGAIGKLPSRQSILVVAVMNGESLNEAGASLGISKTRAHQEYQTALAALRRSAMRHGITGLGTVGWLEEPSPR